MEDIEENLLWQDEGKTEVEVISSDSEFDPYGDSLTCISACN
jgi:hypothetical protein